MIYKDLPKPYANKIITALYELHPEIPTRILSEDVALYQLGFVERIPVTLEIDITPQQAKMVWDEVLSLEYIAFHYTDEELKDPKMRREQQQAEEYYRSFALLEDVMREAM